jgi:hypothetical protein
MNRFQGPAPCVGPRIVWSTQASEIDEIQRYNQVINPLYKLWGD